MRISDWSSDVCSSDLAPLPAQDPLHAGGRFALRADRWQAGRRTSLAARPAAVGADRAALRIGTARDGTGVAAAPGAGVRPALPDPEGQGRPRTAGADFGPDRKSTRLDSSH